MNGGDINGPLVGHDTLVQLDCLVYLNDVASAKGKTIGQVIDNLFRLDSNSYDNYYYMDRSRDPNTGKYPNGLDRYEWISLLRSMQQDEELCKLVVVDGTEDDNVSERAMLLRNPSTNENIIVFRGTVKEDEWLDNQHGFYQSDTEDQKLALEFTNLMAYRHEISNITITGHSKGGNKAMYVAIKTEIGIIGRCVAVNSQGFSDEFVNNQRNKNRIESRKSMITNICAQGDYVSPLLNTIAGNVIFVETGKLDSFVDYHYSSFLLKEGYKGLELMPIVDERCEIHDFIHDLTVFAMKELDLEERETVLRGIFELSSVTEGKGLIEGPKYIIEILNVIRSDYKGIDEEQFKEYVDEGKWSAAEAESARSIASLVVLLYYFTNENPDFTKEMEEDLLDQMGDLYGFWVKTGFSTILGWLDDNPLALSEEELNSMNDVYDIYGGDDYEYHSYRRNGPSKSIEQDVEVPNKSNLSNESYRTRSPIISRNPLEVKASDLSKDIKVQSQRLRTSNIDRDLALTIGLSSIKAIKSMTLISSYSIGDIKIKKLRTKNSGHYDRYKQNANIQHIQNMIRNINRDRDYMEDLLNDLIQSLDLTLRDIDNNYQEYYVKQDIDSLRRRIKTFKRMGQELDNAKYIKVVALRSASRIYEETERKIIREFC